MLFHSVKYSCLRNKRRIADPRGVLEHRWFKTLRREFYRELWRDAAMSVGAQATTQSGGLIRIARAGLVTFVDQSDLMLDSAVATRVMENKTLTYKLMASKGLRIPRHCSYDMSTLDRAVGFMRDINGPVVVKPADGTAGGYGVTTGIRSEGALRSASSHASQFHARNRSLLIEEQLYGASYRLLYLDGQFIDAVRRDSPAVTGDGKSTIRQLVRNENKQRRTLRPRSALSPLTLDQESLNTLAVQQLSPGSVPAADARVHVKRAVNQNAAAQNYVVRDQVNGDLIRAGSKLVQELGISFAGLDVTSHDISAPFEAGDTIFNEINTSPGIHHHYLVANPAARAEVAPRVLERMFAIRSGVIEL